MNPSSSDIALQQRLTEIQTRIAAATARSGRSADAITLVGVSKSADRAMIGAAARLGVRIFGENRIATAEEHFVPPPYTLDNPPALHLIGHLQSNKARRAAQLFSMIHSVDSLSLARALERYRAEMGEGRLPILFEVNIGGEESKSGFTPDAVAGVIAEYIAWNPAHLRLEGLMTIAPLTATPEETRPYFQRMAELFAAQHRAWPTPDGDSAWRWQHLSMGMTNDFEVAIEEGATLVRIGRAIFG